MRASKFNLLWNAFANMTRQPIMCNCAKQRRDWKGTQAADEPHRAPAISPKLRVAYVVKAKLHLALCSAELTRTILL